MWMPPRCTFVLVLAAGATLGADLVSLDTAAGYPRLTGTPLAVLRAEAVALRSATTAHVTVGEARAEHIKLSGSNTRNAKSPEQAQGAGVFKSQQAPIATVEDIDTAHYKMPTPFGNDKFTKTLNPKQKQELLKLVNEYKAQQKIKMLKRVAKIEERAEAEKVKLDQASAEASRVGQNANDKKPSRNKVTPTSDTVKAPSSAAKTVSSARGDTDHLKTAVRLHAMVKAPPKPAALPGKVSLDGLRQHGVADTKRHEHETDTKAEAEAKLNAADAAFARYTANRDSAYDGHKASVTNLKRDSSRAHILASHRLSYHVLSKVMHLAKLKLRMLERNLANHKAAGKAVGKQPMKDGEATALKKLHRVESAYHSDEMKVKHYTSRLAQIEVKESAEDKVVADTNARIKADRQKYAQDSDMEIASKAEVRKLTHSGVTQEVKHSSLHRKRASDIMATYQKNMRNYAANEKSLSTKKVVDERQLDAAEKKLQQDNLAMQSQLKGDMQKVHAKSKLLRDVSKQLHATRQVEKHELIRDMNVINTQLASDEATKASLETLNEPKQQRVVRAQPKPPSLLLQHSGSHAAYLAATKILTQIAVGPQQTLGESKSAFEAAEAAAMSDLPAANEGHETTKPAQNSKEKHHTRAQAEARLKAAEEAIANLAKSGAIAQRKGAEMQREAQQAEMSAEKNAMTSRKQSGNEHSEQSGDQTSLAQEAENSAEQVIAQRSRNNVKPREMIPAKSVLSPSNRATMQQQAEVAAQEKIAWEQKEKDFINLQREQQLVEDAERNHAHVKPPSEVAKASAELEAEHVLAKEKAAQLTHRKGGKHVVHRVNRPASKPVAVKKSHVQGEKKKVHLLAKAVSKSTKESAHPDGTAKHSADLHGLQMLGIQAEQLAEKTVVAEDAAKMKAYKSHGR